MKPRNELALPSLGQRLTVTLGRPSGFDYLRLGLAVSVVVVHSRATTFGLFPGDVKDPVILLTRAPVHFSNAIVSSLLLVVSGVLVAVHKSILPMFFALSGFLVAGSLERSKTLVSFLGLRIIRIYPALTAEVLLSAFLIGPFVTSLPLASYFRDPLFLHYLLNTVGDIHYFLPGVFANNPWPGYVNYQLWTVPYELLCYATLAGLVLLGTFSRKIIIPLAVFALLVEYFAHRFRDAEPPIQSVIGHLDGQLLVAAFLAGVSLYIYRERIAWSLIIFTSAAISTVPLLWIIPYGECAAILTLSYMTVYLGLTNFKRRVIIRGADYSYGIYLYGFVNQQLFVHAAAPRSWYVNALVCVPLTALVAAVSWHFLEKPAQNLRRPLMQIERRYLELCNRLSTRLWAPRSVTAEAETVSAEPRSRLVPIDPKPSGERTSEAITSSD